MIANLDHSAEVPGRHKQSPCSMFFEDAHAIDAHSMELLRFATLVVVAGPLARNNWRLRLSG